MTVAKPALNPQLHRLLQMFGLDRTWIRAEGAWLYDEHGAAFLDCFSQYGAIALGHNAACVTNAVQSALGDREPAMVQPFRAPYAVQLAKRLVEIASGEMTHCVFTNSGAETVECAIKAARASTGRPIILSCEGAYHGKTLGAMAASGDSVYASLYGPSPPGFDRIPYGDSSALATYLADHEGEVAAFMLEPIQGEGGVQLPPDGYLSEVREICSRHGVAMVLDEIQTGLGRTGRLFCYEHEQIAPDILLIAKALGGGLFPIGACLLVDDFWAPGFALTHSSTFANNNIASRVALSVLETIHDSDFCEDVARKGRNLLRKLEELAMRYPMLIRDVRGRGLMLALELNSTGFSDGMFASYVQHQKLYGFAFSATLAADESIIAVPSLGRADTIRIMPPLIITDEQIDQIVAGLDRVMNAFSQRLTETMVRAMNAVSRLPDEAEEDRAAVILPPSKRTKGNGGCVSRFAFLVHYTQLSDLLITDPALRIFGEEEMRHYCSFIAEMPPGVVFELEKLKSSSGAEVGGYLIALGMLPEEMYRRGVASVNNRITIGVDLAADLGAQVVGLGAFTSIFSRQGSRVTGRGPAITTGNILTAAMAHKAIRYVADRQGLSIRDARVGIVGARGSVGSLCAQLLARDKPRSMLLVGNSDTKIRHLNAIQDRLRRHASCSIDISTDLDRLRDCDVIVSATSARHPLLDDVELSANTIICDVARPQDAGPVTRGRSDLTVVDGGLVALPDPTTRFGTGNIQGFPDGIQLACLSETMLLALAEEKRDFGIGNSATLDDVDYVSDLADRHGFTLATSMLDRAISDSSVFEKPNALVQQGARL